MSYATIAQLQDFTGEARLAQLLPEASGEYVQELLDAASGDLDAALSGRYTVPIVTTSLPLAQATRLDALLAHWTCTIALWTACSNAGMDIPKAVEKAYDALRERLERIGLAKDRLPFLAGLDRPNIEIVGSTDEGAIKSELKHGIFTTARLFP